MSREARAPRPVILDEGKSGIREVARVPEFITEASILSNAVCNVLTAESAYSHVANCVPPVKLVAVDALGVPVKVGSARGAFSCVYLIKSGIICREPVARKGIRYSAAAAARDVSDK